jgi:hypothetical protein
VHVAHGLARRFEGALDGIEPGHVQGLGEGGLEAGLAL